VVSVKSWAGHRYRELLVHCRRLIQPANPGRRVVIFPGEAGTGGGSDLRAAALASELRRLGWRTTTVPSQLELKQRLRVIRVERPDVILMHQSRHPLNRPRLYGKTPCVFDADDADILDPNCRDAVIECCADSAAVIAGSRFLADEFRRYNSQVSIVWTGTYLGASGRIAPNESRVPSVAWATSNAFGYSHEAEFVREVIVRLSRKVRFTYIQYGVDPDRRSAVEEFLEPIRCCGVPVQVFGPMAYTQFTKSLESVAVGLQPVCWENPFSRGKSFGKILAYLAADVAVVASDAVDHPLFFQDGLNGVLETNEVDRWVDRILLLLQRPSVRAGMVAQARADFLTRLTTASAAKYVDAALIRAIGVSRK
jgi:hypothetical protein